MLINPIMFQNQLWSLLCMFDSKKYFAPVIRLYRSPYDDDWPTLPVLIVDRTGVYDRNAPRELTNVLGRLERRKRRCDAIRRVIPFGFNFGVDFTDVVEIGNALGMGLHYKDMQRLFECV